MLQNLFEIFKCNLSCVQHDTDDDSCQSSELTAERSQDEGEDVASKAFELVVRGLTRLGRLLVTVVRAIIRVCTSKPSSQQLSADTTDHIAS